MQINSIQTSQPSFGTKVKINPGCFRELYYLNSLNKGNYTKTFDKLANNGRNDILTISEFNRDQLYAVLYEIKRSNKPNGFAQIRQSDGIHFYKEDWHSLEYIYDCCRKNIQDSWVFRITESKLKEWEKCFIF